MKRNIALAVSLVLLIFLMTSTVAKELAPDFTLTDIDGVEFSLSDHRVKVVLLYFFMIQCTGCVAEMQQLNIPHQEFGENVTIVSISIDPYNDTPEKLQQLRQANNISWVIARDTIDVSSNYNIQVAGTLVIIDKDGYIQYRHVGFPDESVLRQEISGIIPEFEWPSIMLVFLILTIIMAISKRRSLSNDRSIGRKKPTIRSIRPWSLCL